MEGRKNRKTGSDRISGSSDVPVDFAKMVTEVYQTNFEAGLKALEEITKAPSHFEMRGTVFSDEICVALTLVTKGEIAATTVWASVDFDPRASAPTAQDVLALCVDAIGSIFGLMLDADQPDQIERLASRSLSAFEGIPFHWTAAEFDRKRVWLKVDKSNPSLDQAADQFLAQHDPGLLKEEDELEEEAKKLFVRGPSDGDPAKKGKPGSGMDH